VADLKGRLKKLEATYKESRDAMNQELKSLVSQVEDIELEMHRLKTSASNALANNEKVLQQITYEAAHVSELQAEEIEAVWEEIRRAVDELTQHKIALAQAVDSAELRSRQIKQAVM
jgi:prefoldin subunit 5